MSEHLIVNELFIAELLVELAAQRDAMEELRKTIFSMCKSNPAIVYVDTNIINYLYEVER